MNAVTQLQPTGPTSPVPAAASESAAIVSMIERAARDPSVDIDKMQRLLELRRQIKADEARAEFAVSMKTAQSEMRPVVKDAENKQTRSTYATLSAIDDAIRSIYTRHGFSLSFDTGESPLPDHVRVLCDVFHDAGHSRQHHIDMPADGKGAKGGDVMTKTHATMSATSYGQRALVKLIFNISTRSSDDDGNAASATVATITDEQADELMKLLTDTKSNLVKFLAAIKLESLTQIRADKFEAAKKLITDTAAKRAAREAKSNPEGAQA